MSSSVLTVPFNDLHLQYTNLKGELDAVIGDVIASSSFIRGPYVDQFEHDFAVAIGTTECVSCANGTDAIYIAMTSLGVKPGDEVIVPAMSWISTSETVSQTGARPVFCEIDPITYTIDPEHLAKLVTSRTVGIIPVHLYGQPADMDPIMQTADQHGLWVIEDCAQAHLAKYKGKQIGTFGVAATFSFYPGKNLGAMGDAGGIVTSDSALASKMAMFARHGGLTKGDHQIEGINSRMDGLQAAILTVKLKCLQDWTTSRENIAARYDAALQDMTGFSTPLVAEGRQSVWHLYVIRTPNRAELAQHLKSNGIGMAINYPRALPMLPCYADWGHVPADFPVANELAEQCLSIPIFPEMTLEQQDRVVTVLAEWSCR